MLVLVVVVVVVVVVVIVEEVKESPPTHVRNADGISIHVTT